MTATRKLFATLLGLAALTFAGLGLFAGPTEAASTPPDGVIQVIEHPGYFETRGNIFQLEPGTYVFEVENRSGKNAGFVVAPEGEPAVSIAIANGESGRLEVELGSGNHTYYCPIIPTPPYPISVN